MENLKLTAKTFNKMKKLRYLKIYTSYPWLCYNQNISVPTVGLESISRKITYFPWEQYPGMSLPSNFCAKLLLELNLEESEVEMLWDGVQVLFINFKLII